MAGWPDTTEFTDYLIASGLYGLNPTAAQQKLDLQGALDAAVDAWNERTHYWPFLSDGAAKEERRFDPPWPETLLDLNGGLVGVNKVQIDVTYGNTSPSTLTELRDYWLRPSDAAKRGKPWTSVLLRRIYSVTEPASIAVTGEWGYCSALTLPEAARRAVMAIAAGSLLQQIMTQAASGGLIELTEGDVTKRWDFGKTGDMWRATADDAVNFYRRPRIE